MVVSEHSTHAVSHRSDPSSSKRRFTVHAPEGLSEIPGFDELVDEFVALRIQYQHELNQLFLPGRGLTPQVDPIKEKYEPRLNELYQDILALGFERAFVQLNHDG